MMLNNARYFFILAMENQSIARIVWKMFFKKYIQYERKIYVLDKFNIRC